MGHSHLGTHWRVHGGFGVVQLAGHADPHSLKTWPLTGHPKEISILFLEHACTIYKIVCSYNYISCKIWQQCRKWHNKTAIPIFYVYAYLLQAFLVHKTTLGRAQVLQKNRGWKNSYKELKSSNWQFVNLVHLPSVTTITSRKCVSYFITDSIMITSRSCIEVQVNVYRYNQIGSKLTTCNFCTCYVASNVTGAEYGIVKWR